MDTRALGNVFESQGISRLTVERPAGFVHKPGQVAALALGRDEIGYFAIATPPGEPILEFLVKRAGADPRMLGVGANDHIEVRGPFGAGFDVPPHALDDDARLLFVGAGTALAALRPAMIVASRSHPLARLGLVVGVRALADLAFADEIAAWSDGGMTVRIVVSGPDPTAPAPRRGWVQDHVADLMRPGTRLFLAGSDQLEDAVEAVALGAGMPRAAIQRNFRPDSRSS